MTLEPSAEPTMSMLGLSGSLTAGSESLSDIVQTVIGKLGEYPVLGCFERDLRKVLNHSGMPEESIQDISQEIIRGARLMLRGVLVSFISDTLTVLTELQKPKSTSTSESQNEEMG